MTLCLSVLKLFDYIKEKTDEIPAGPVLLRKMDLKGKTVARGH